MLSAPLTIARAKEALRSARKAAEGLALAASTPPAADHSGTLPALNFTSTLHDPIHG